VTSLLVIEPSSALANLLIRTLKAGGYSSVTHISDYGEAAALVTDSDEYAAVILGMPQSKPSQIKPLLKSLQQNRDNPLMLLLHGPSPVLDDWAKRRGKVSLLAWQQFSRIPLEIKSILPEEEKQNLSSGSGKQSRSVRILFVDDSKSARYTYSRLLAAQGFPVDVASTIKEAEEAALKSDYELIIVDYYLPDGTGDMLCARLKAAKKTANATLAIITGSYRESIIKDCLDAGAIECMFKNEAKELFLTRVSSIAASIESQRSVEAERQRLDGILGSVGEGVYGVDELGIITFVNPTGLKILGYSDVDFLVGKQVHRVIHSSDSIKNDDELIHSYSNGGSLSGHETVFRHKSGSALPVELTLFPLSIQSERQGSVVVFRDISERKNVEQLQWEVTHDPLTGLSNRRHFSNSLETELARLRDEGGNNALLYIDLDRFADIVEAGGESEGDRVLAEVAGRLSTQLRERDFSARMEEDVFVLLLSGIQLSNIFTVSDAFRRVLSETQFDYHGVKRRVVGSIGVVILSRLTPSAEYALEHARLACEEAKKKGRNQTYIYVSEEDAKTKRELESGWIERFKEAIHHDRFVFLAQPIVNTAAIPLAADLNEKDDLTKTSMGEDNTLLFELLLRMVSRDGQWVSPSVFVPLAERVNMIQDVDLWVVRHAMEALKKLSVPDHEVCFTINLSNVTLQDPESLSLIIDLVKQNTDIPGRLIFEITETAEIASLHNARKFMLELKKLGCRFALDDFGTGFSSFSHLKHLPVDFIKIDGMFVQSMASNRVDRTMVNSMTSMAHSLGLQTIAEHVDSTGTLEAAKTSGVDYVQGYYFGEPILLDKLDISSMT